MSKIKVWTLDLGGNYPPAIKAITFPWLKHYAKKIGASFEVITEDKFPGWPDRTNKFQLFEFLRGEEDTWAIFFDADTLINPDQVNFAELISPDTVMHNANDFSPIRWKPDNYFLRDGRHLGSCSWFFMAHSMCRDFFTPPTMQQHETEDRFLTLDEIVDRIRPTQNEVTQGLSPDHLIDDYCLSRNISRFGLKFTSVLKIMQRNMIQGSYFMHQYLMTVPKKVEELKKVHHIWQLDGNVPPCDNQACPRCHPGGAAPQFVR